MPRGGRGSRERVSPLLLCAGARRIGMLRLRLLSVVAILVASATAAQAQTSVRVTASALNVRSGPGTGYSIIGQIFNGQKYVRIASSGEWRKIWYDHRVGWVHSAYITADGAPERRVTASSLNVRTGPGMGYGVVG